MQKSIQHKSDKPNFSIHEIANRANVSVATVSRVLNNKPDVNPRTREKILRLIDGLEYVPKIVRNTKDTVGIVFHKSSAPFRIEYFSEAVNAITDVATANNMSVNLIPVDYTFTRAADLKHHFRMNNLLGFIFMNPSVDTDLVKEVARAGIPCVAVGAVYEEQELNWVSADNRKGAMDAVDHLVGLGHKRIAMICHMLTSYDHLERAQGYRGALDTFGIPYDDTLFFEGKMCIPVILERLMRSPSPPTAILVSSYEDALEVISRLFEMGFDVPRDVSVVGFGDYRLAKYFRPPLTTVRVPIYDLGRLATEVLLRVSSEGCDHVFRRFLDMELVIRASTRKLTE